MLSAAENACLLLDGSGPKATGLQLHLMDSVEHPQFFALTLSVPSGFAKLFDEPKQKSKGSVGSHHKQPAGGGRQHG